MSREEQQLPTQQQNHQTFQQKQDKEPEKKLTNPINAHFRTTSCISQNSDPF
jgi:hypothetical protein